MKAFKIHAGKISEGRELFPSSRCANNIAAAAIVNGCYYCGAKESLPEAYVVNERGVRLEHWNFAIYPFSSDPYAPGELFAICEKCIEHHRELFPLKKDV